LDPPRPWVHARALEVIHTSPFSLVERTNAGIRKRCWGPSAVFSLEALVFLRGHPSLDRYFVRVLDDVYLVDDKDKPCHVTLLEEYAFDGYSYAETFGGSKTHHTHAMPLIHFVIDAHLALDAIQDASFVFPDVKLENLLVDANPNGTIERVVWGDLESLRPYPCRTPMRYTLHYLPPSMIVPTLDANTPYFQGERHSLKAPHSKLFTKRVLKEQVAIFAACLLTGSFPPVDVWWMAFEDKSVGSVLCPHVEKEPWWQDCWKADFCEAPFSLASRMSPDALQAMKDLLSAKIMELFWQDVEGEYMEVCAEEEFPLGSLDVWLAFLRVAFDPDTSLKDLQACDFLSGATTSPSH